MNRDFVARNDQERARLEQLVARLSEADMARRLDGGWTVGDALGHLAFYDRRAAVLLERFAREGVTASPYDFETINQALLFLTRGMPPQAIAAAALPESLLAEVDARNEVRVDRSEHRRNHLDEIEAALAAP